MRTWSGVMTTGCPVLSVVRACCARCSPTTLSAASVDSMSSALSSCSKVSCLLSSRVIAVRNHSSAASFRTRDCSSLVLRVAFALLCSDSVFTFQCGLLCMNSLLWGVRSLSSGVRSLSSGVRSLSSGVSSSTSVLSNELTTMVVLSLTSSLACSSTSTVTHSFPW